MLACGSDSVDLEPPTMQVLSFTPSPLEGNICGSSEPNVFHLTGGDQLAFDVIFQDDEALSQYKVDIHNNFDCHGHGGGSAPSLVITNVDNLTTDWTVLEIDNISGSTASVDRVFEVPENVTTGSYHFQIQVIDESGNDNPAANFFSLNIKHPLDDVRPEITVQIPGTNAITVQRGEQITFQGQVTDNRSLSDGGNGVLYLSYTDLSSGNTFATGEAIAFDDTIDTSYDFDFDYQVPTTLVTGSYRFSLGANDGVRNVAEFIFFEVEVTD